MKYIFCRCSLKNLHEKLKILLNIASYIFRYQKEKEAYKVKQAKREIDALDFVKILGTSAKAALTPEIVKSGFRAGGIFPWKRAAVHDDRLVGSNSVAHDSVSTDRPHSTSNTSSVAAISAQNVMLSSTVSLSPSISPNVSTSASISSSHDPPSQMSNILAEIRFLTQRYKSGLPNDDKESKICCAIMEQQINLLAAKPQPANPEISISEILPRPPPNVRVGDRKHQMKINNGVMSVDEVITTNEKLQREKENLKEGVLARKRQREERNQDISTQPKKPRGRPPKTVSKPQAPAVLSEDDESE